MLRNFFPHTNEGANLFGGFMRDSHYFTKVFDMKQSIEESLVSINEFLEQNGYEVISRELLDETNSYEKKPVSLSPHGYKEQFVLTITRDALAKSETEFLIHELIKFRDKRDWSQFHNPKDLAVAINVEAGELLELFLWKKPEDANKKKIKEELADILAFAFLLADKYGLNIEQIVLEKIRINGDKYPIDKAKGTAKKYNEL